MPSKQLTLRTGAIEKAKQPAEGATVPAKRRAPRKLNRGPIVKIRLTADDEETAERAAALVEEALAAQQCRMQRPRQGSNPKYADDPKWMSYGDFELVTKGRKR